MGAALQTNVAQFGVAAQLVPSRGLGKKQWEVVTVQCCLSRRLLHWQQAGPKCWGARKGWVVSAALLQQWFLHRTLLLWRHCEQSSLHGAVAKICRDLLAQASIVPYVCRCFAVWHQSLSYDSASLVVPYGSRMNEWSLRSAPSHLWVLWIIWEVVTENQFLYLGLMDHWMAWDTVRSGRLYGDNVACKTKLLLVEQRFKKKKKWK